MGFQLVEGNPSIVYIGEHTTSGSFAAGDPVKVETTGLLKLASSSAAVFGIALKAASGTASTSIPVIVLTPDLVWSIETDSATTPAITHLGIAYDLTIATGATVLNLAGGESTEKYVVVELDERDTPAAGTRVLVRASVAVSDAMGNVT